MSCGEGGKCCHAPEKAANPPPRKQAGGCCGGHGHDHHGHGPLPKGHPAAKVSPAPKKKSGPGATIIGLIVLVVALLAGLFLRG